MLMSDGWVDMVEVPRQPHLRCPGFILMTLVCLPDPITVAGKGWRDVTSCTVTLLEGGIPAQSLEAFRAPGWHSNRREAMPPFSEDHTLRWLANV